jgi:hypothetical protein
MEGFSCDIHGMMINLQDQIVSRKILGLSGLSCRKIAKKAVLGLQRLNMISVCG